MWYQLDGDSIKIFVYVQPGAKSTELLGIYDNALKIRLRSLAIEGRANEALQRYLAEIFEVSLRQVQLIRGEKSRRKTLKIMGSQVNPESLIKTLS